MDNHDTCWNKGKKNDHVTYIYSLDHIIKHHDKEIIASGGNIVENNVVWTDNSPNQYKKRQKIYNLASYSK